MPRARADFRPELFDDLIEKKGYQLVHYKGMLCPCLNPATGQPDPNCNFCERGWQYYGKEDIAGVITGVTHEKQYAEAGGFMLGAMQLTVKADVRLGYHDRIIHTDSIIPFSELITRSDTDKDRLKYLPAEFERIVDAAGKEYQQGVNFTVDDRVITWMGDSIPAPGAPISLAYMTHPVWLVLNYLHLIRDTRIKFRKPFDEPKRLPIQVLCKLEWLMED
jgi:hypothetical protein